MSHPRRLSFDHCLPREEKKMELRDNTRCDSHSYVGVTWHREVLRCDRGKPIDRRALDRRWLLERETKPRRGGSSERARRAARKSCHTAVLRNGCHTHIARTKSMSHPHRLDRHTSYYMALGVVGGSQGAQGRPERSEGGVSRTLAERARRSERSQIVSGGPAAGLPRSTGSASSADLIGPRRGSWGPWRRRPQCNRCMTLPWTSFPM